MRISLGLMSWPGARVLACWIRWMRFLSARARPSAHAWLKAGTTASLSPGSRRAFRGDRGSRCAWRPSRQRHRCWSSSRWQPSLSVVEDLVRLDHRRPHARSRSCSTSHDWEATALTPNGKTVAGNPDVEFDFTSLGRQEFHKVTAQIASPGVQVSTAGQIVALWGAPGHADCELTGQVFRRPLSRSWVRARIVTLPRHSVVCAGDHASQSNIQPPSSCCADSTASR
jgi:hypothetical protein